VDSALSDVQRNFVNPVGGFSRRKCGTPEQREELTIGYTEAYNGALYGTIGELDWLRVTDPAEYEGSRWRDSRIETDDEERTLTELFDGCSQLMIYRFTFGPTYDAGCPVCSSGADTFDRAILHLNARDVTFTCASRAAPKKLLACRARMWWSFPYSFAAEKEGVFQMYSTTGRELEPLPGYYAVLDHAPRGRHEDSKGTAWIRRRDEYA
jgi:predicted dithiol-disulfide oxidoreductase (DUF899 family)